ncbi:hypothetical protein T02_6410 [Trichinella nativa]|uniref:Uncharacterized protein n=1 Tax=Trichinella nativa TaxID=6335 RepID=A0A0V1KWL4_9BILA|nr:hypothetical protein T02_6410 [Trichinella nativa]
MRLILLQNIDKQKSSLILLSYKRAVQKRTQGIADVLANKGALEIDAEQTTDHRRRSPWGTCIQNSPALVPCCDGSLRILEYSSAV